MEDDEVATIAEELANWGEYCKCTEDYQADPRCDGTRCIEQQRAIEAALRIPANRLIHRT